MQKYLVSLLLLLACNSNDNTDLNIFNDIFYKVDYNEKVVFLDSGIKSAFDDYYEGTYLKIPILKTFKSDSSLRYLGIPYNTSLLKIKESLKTSKPNSEIKTDNSSYLYFYSKESTRQTVAYYLNNNSNLVSLLIIDSSKLERGNKYVLDSISKKLYQKTNES